MSLKKLFTRRKNKDKLWEEEIEEGPPAPRTEEEKTSIRYFFQNVSSSIKGSFDKIGSHRIHIPYFLKVKRFLAFVYFMVFVFAGLSFFNVFGLFFLGASVICFDYLLKTRR